MTEEEKAAVWSEEITGGRRTPREAAEERLRGWLKRKWSGAPSPVGPLPWPESACILAGLDPEASADADPAGWAFLPGALAFYGFSAFPRDRHGLHELRSSVEEHIGLLRGLHLKTMDAKKAIAEAKRAGLPIPWLKSTAAEPEENRRANASYAALYRDRPNWDAEMRDIERLVRERKTNDQVASALAMLGYKVRSPNSLDGIIRAFRNGKTTAEEKTAGFCRYKERMGLA